MSANYDHHRVSDQGLALGNLTARMAEAGEQCLSAAGLSGPQNLPGMRDDMCASCACRRGTVPNGCLQTQMDLIKAVVDGLPFICHAPRDGRLCAGWVRVRALHAATPLPAGVQEIVARWDYSAPDNADASAP